MHYSTGHSITMRLVLTGIVVIMAADHVRAEDWPTLQHDNRRSCVTSEHLNLPLQMLWELRPDPPRTAWAGPAKWDSYANIVNVKAMRNFDPVFYTTVVQGRVYYGSSVDDGVHCVDVKTGQEAWAFLTDGPVRLPPTYVQGTIIFGSDDGNVYCVDTATAQLIWKVRPVQTVRKIPNNGKLISMWPCRTGVLVQDAIAYFAMSLLPWRTTYVCAVDVHTGAFQGPGLYKETFEHLTAQGPLLASSEHLYMSQGRQAPLVFRRHDGKRLQSLGKSGWGGVYGLLSKDATFVHGHGQTHDSLGELRFFNGKTQDLFMVYPRATTIVMNENMIYLHADTLLQALRKDRFLLSGPTSSDFLWKVNCDCPLSLILAGNTLFAGGKHKVSAHDAQTGQTIWEAAVPGRAYGLTVSHGCLIVSTDQGRILCFGGL